MKYVYYCFFFLISSSLFAQEQRTMIVNTDVFDGEKLHKNVNVLFHKGKILKIAKGKPEQEGDRLIKGSGKTVIPPLVNAHVHVWFAQNMKGALKEGVFALLDMHSSDYYANVMRRYNDSLNYALYYGSNAGATVPGGHGTQFGIPVPTINDTLSAAQFVRDRAAQGADYIKILKEPGRPTVTEAHTADIIKTAQQVGLMPVSHVSKAGDAVVLAQQGIGGFVHMWLDRKADENEWETLEKADLFIVPTLLVYKSLFDERAKKGIENKYMPIEKMMEEVLEAHRRGIPILAGTDSPNLNLNYDTALFDEIILLHKSGLSREEALQAATLNAYKAFNLPEFQKLETGTAASFMLVDGKPLEDLEQLKQPKQIFREGIEIK